MVAPNIAQDDTTTNVKGFYTLQNHEQGKVDTTDTLSHDNTQNTTDTLCMLYAKQQIGRMWICMTIAHIFITWTQINKHIVM